MMDYLKSFRYALDVTDSKIGDIQATTLALSEPYQNIQVAATPFPPPADEEQYQYQEPTDYFSDDDQGGGQCSPNSPRIDLELPRDFIFYLVKLYGSQPGADLSRLSSRSERTIKVSTGMCFDIFRHLYSTVENRERSAQNFVFPDENGRQHRQNGRHHHQNGLEQDEEASSSSSSSSSSSNSCTNNVSRSNSSSNNSSPTPPSSPTTMDPDEEEDFQEILRQIAILEEESDRAFALQLEQLERQGVEDAAVAGFKDIIQRDKLKAARELLKYQELRKIKWTMAQNIKCSQLKAVFPSLQPKIVEDTFLEKDFNYEQALAWLRDIYPSKFVPPRVLADLGNKSGGGGGGRVRTPSGSDWFYEPDAVAALSQMEKAKLLEQATLWRMEADHCAKKYESAKADAANQKLVKPAYSLKMTDASAHRHDANKALEQYWFFTLMGLNAGNKNPNKIDLHGLGVNKAKEIAQKYLQNRKSWATNHLPKNGTVTLTIITGQGRHSVNNIPRLYPAIRGFLQDNHYSFTEGESAGNFFIRLTNQEEKKAVLLHQTPKKIAIKPRMK